MKIYNSKIKDIRLAKRFTMTALADEIGVSRQTYFNWESGRNKPSEDNVRKLACIFDVSVDEISSLSPEISQDTNFLKEMLPDFLKIMNSTLKERFNIRDSIVEQVTQQSNNLEQVLAILKNFLDSFDSILYSKDLNGRFLLANDSFRKSLKLKKDFIVTGLNDFDIHPHELAQKIYSEDINVIKTGIPIIREGYIPGFGKKKWGIFFKEPVIATDHKNILGMICYITDITEQKKREKALLSTLKSCFKKSNEACFCILNNDDQLFIDREAAVNILGVPNCLSDDLFKKYCIENIIIDDSKNDFLQPKSNNETHYQIKHPIKGFTSIKEKFIQLPDTQLFILENTES